MSRKLTFRLPFKLLDTKSTIQLGISTVTTLLLCLLVPLIFVMIGFQLDSENLEIVQWLLYTIAFGIFLSGLIGLLLKQFADALSIGLTLHEEKTTNVEKTHATLSYYDSLTVGIQYLGVILSVVLISSFILFFAGYVGDMAPQSFECSNGTSIPFSSLEDGIGDCMKVDVDASGNTTGPYWEDEAPGLYQEYASPNPLYGQLEFVLRVLSAVFFIGGMIGLAGKLLADSISIGLTLHHTEEAESSENTTNDEIGHSHDPNLYREHPEGSGTYWERESETEEWREVV